VDSHFLCTRKNEQSIVYESTSRKPEDLPSTITTINILVCSRCALIYFMRASKTDQSLSRSKLQVSLVLDGAVAVRIAAAVRRSGPCSGSIRITIARDQGIHTGSIDRYTLASVLMEAIADGSVAFYQRCPQVLHRADVRVRLGCARAAA